MCIRDRRERIKGDMAVEEQRFDHTLREGLVEFTRAVEAVRQNGSDTLPGKTAFYLHDTMGFPVELTADLLRDAGIKLDREGFDALLNDQRHGCLLYTSDAADDLLCVDLGGRRII